MSSYILLERLKVENANALAGMTYGFPAITAFLGLTHALSRKFKEQFAVELTGCGIFCHDYEVGTYKEYGKERFVQNRCPPPTLKDTTSEQKKGKKVAIIEEAKMDMTVSLLFKCDTPLSTNNSNTKAYKNALTQWVYQSRLAGGSIHHLADIKFINNNDSQNTGLAQLKKAVLPSFVLLNASHYLKEHEQYCLDNQMDKNAFDRWTDFFAFKHQAKYIETDNTDNETSSNEFVWERIIPPNKKGWIVPLMVGFKGISPLYSPDEVENLRDQRYPFRFVEAVHGLGEWKSTHRISDIDSLIWRYDCCDEWYLCTQDKAVVPHQTHPLDDIFEDDNLFS